MAYTKTTWKTGDIINADGMNNIETGIEEAHTQVTNISKEIDDLKESGGSGGEFGLPLLYEVTTTEEIKWIDTGDNAFLAKNMLIIELDVVHSATNTEDLPLSASAYVEGNTPINPHANRILTREMAAGLPKQYDKTIRMVGFKGDTGHWSVLNSIRNCVNDSLTSTNMQTETFSNNKEIRGVIIGNASAVKTGVFGVGTVLKIWGR